MNADHNGGSGSPNRDKLGHFIEHDYLPVVHFQKSKLSGS